MADVVNDNRVISLVGRPGIRNTLVTLLDQLQRCQKSLNEFLEVLVLFVNTLLNSL
jgi:dynein heavy chain 2